MRFGRTDFRFAMAQRRIQFAGNLLDLLQSHKRTLGFLLRASQVWILRFHWQDGSMMLLHVFLPGRHLHFLGAHGSERKSRRREYRYEFPRSFYRSASFFSCSLLRLVMMLALLHRSSRLLPGHDFVVLF